ncbi:MAG: S1 RNA-binding domain-containing protein [Richelia sp. RM2_1_2]|nr:S1 RNA-binding domain-containing protein [Richelia sp. SM2_1_7]NJM21513.1 S1 RNA-binding domain-containing protein [Richelia sp. SM1_7_0]NJN07081.1 S1 RNA-binding domain-containing protein [Richelia sp. RM1_1_1]NJO29280.1 S1 RNA-binding domain-containing protein [Richelia sp. SL_2_1]NJO58460.1 S1 RNA-binding domain-containing protein [Richelia sp. RM2_1_2]NJS16320.1 S1 RNA-binding domain-containing protein [Nostocaceae cyanobacterium CSU_2_110]
MENEANISQKAETSFTMDDFAAALEKHDYQFQKGQLVKGKVFQIDPMGAYVDIGGKSSAFIPRHEAALREVIDLSSVLPLHEELEFLIIQEQDAEGQVTLSRRQLEIRQIWDRLLQMQESSKSVDVEVTNANKGGVTVNILGLRGFIPRSHLLERNNLEALRGQKLTVSFLEINRNINKLVLSQRLAKSSASFSLLEIGQLIEGKITGIKPFGVFIDINGVSALLHIKQVTQKFIENLEKVFQIDQTIKALIIDIDEGKGRIAVSTRVLENFPGEILENIEEVMSSAEARAERARKQLLESANA